MGKFKLSLITDNDAFGDYPGYEIARILRGAAEVIQEGSEVGVLKDYNGNTVGEYRLEGEGE